MLQRFSSLPTTCMKWIAPLLRSRCTGRGIPYASSRWLADSEATARPPNSRARHMELGRPAGWVNQFDPANARHGASPTTSTTQIAIGEMLDGKAVEGMEHVTDVSPVDERDAARE